jgi:putative membrane protein
MQLMIILAIVFAIASVVFALQNALSVTVTFLLWRFDSSLAIVLLLALACGALIVALLSTPATLRARWQLQRQRRQITQLEAENSSLKQQVERAAATDHSGKADLPESRYVGLKTLMSGAPASDESDREDH